MPVFASTAAYELSNLIATIPDSSQVLVVMDYEPSLAGELEATAGPVFDQLANSRHSVFTFVSTSPNGVGLVDRLLYNTNVTKPTPDGAAYQAGSQYFNAGFLPGGSTGVLAFIKNAPAVMPNAAVSSFSDFKAIVILTDNAESGRSWLEQLSLAQLEDPSIANNPVLVVSSAQSGPMLKPYASSKQTDILVNGLYDAVKYEYVNNTRPGIARAYWDAFGAGLMMAILAIVVGNVWNLLAKKREQDAEKELG
jgi:hypothetical protein